MYNRFRFYDPAGGVYGAQDPLGVGPNVGTAQGYVANPLTWVDALGLKAHPIADAIRNSTDDLQQKVVGVMDNAGDGARRYGALAMAEVTDSAGNKTILAASNGRDGAILRNDIRRHLPDDVVAVRSQITEGVVGRNAHAEEPLVNYCKANNLSINKLAASRGVCKDVCQSLVENVNVVTPLVGGGNVRRRNGSFHHIPYLPVLQQCLARLFPSAGCRILNLCSLISFLNALDLVRLAPQTRGVLSDRGCCPYRGWR